MLPLPEEHHPRVAAFVGSGLLAMVLAVVSIRVGQTAWPALVLPGQLLGLVGLAVFVSAGVLYTALLLRDLVVADSRG